MMPFGSKCDTAEWRYICPLWTGCWWECMVHTPSMKGVLMGIYDAYALYEWGTGRDSGWRARAFMVVLWMGCSWEFTQIAKVLRSTLIRHQSNVEVLDRCVINVDLLVFVIWVGYISMAQCKTAVTPLLTHWSSCSLALSHRYSLYGRGSDGNLGCKVAVKFWACNTEG